MFRYTLSLLLYPLRWSCAQYTAQRDKLIALAFQRLLQGP
jgi:hypothetical protein